MEGGTWNGEDGESGERAEAVLRMLARLRLPGGLLLPWDHYGYVLPSHSALAYAAYRTGDPFYRELLEHHSDFSYTLNAGWGSDDTVWTLIWWPESPSAWGGLSSPPSPAGVEETRARKPAPRATEPAPRGAVTDFPSWAEPEVGAALVSGDASLYLMQMWDEAGVPEPGRAHMNPNAVVLSAWHTPLTVDGVTTKECVRFNFDDTWREVGYMFVGTTHRYNYGSGCAGSHSVLLVDGWEGFRARSAYRQAELVEAGADSVTADVTPVYREAWGDTRQVRRRSRLVADRFWLIEDLALFGEEHEVTARWWLRPEVTRGERGVVLETPEGVRLHLLPLLGPDECTVETVAGYPDRLDGESRCVDFRQRGRECRWLWLAFPERTRREVAQVAEGWAAVPDPEGALDLAAARAALEATDLRLPLTQPAHLLADVPLARRWWYRREVEAPAGPGWLSLPRMMGAPRVWVKGAELDLSGTLPRRELLEVQVELPGGTAEVIVSCEAQIEHLSQDLHDTIRGFSGRPAILAPAQAPGVSEARYENGVVTVRSGEETWRVEHELMRGPTP